MLIAAGTRIDRYEIVAFIGRGGMGEVYRARDTVLQRSVAIKFLASVDERSGTRSLQEARAASGLNHPNICTIYAVNQVGDRPFIVMEHVDGRTLSALIAVEPCSVNQTVRLGVQLADALAHAHGHGIVHCDLKSSNIMVGADGRAKVLDFGLAVRQPADDEDVTQSDARVSGQIPGTLPYLAPELLKGNTNDRLSDIWALGVVLYTMVAGELPFSGQTAFELTAAILHQSPLDLPASVPASLRLIVSRCLSKERSRRYQRASEVAAALETVSSDATAKSPGLISSRTRRPANSLAVMPLTNASHEADAEYLGDGITEAIINSLARLPNLRIIPRSTVFRFKERNIDPFALGRELDVRSVVTGRVEQRGDMLTVGVELVDTATQSQVWGGRYQRRVADIFEMQEQIAHQIAETLRVKLSGQDRRRMARRFTHNVEAYQLYLRGRYFWNKRPLSSLEKAIGYFQQAIDCDPGYALPYTGLADAYNILGGYGVRRPQEVFPLAKAAATTALRIDDSMAEPHSSLGWIHFYYDWDWNSGEREFRRAIARNPTYVFAHLWYAICLGWLGRSDEAIHCARRGQQLEPLLLTANAIVGLVLYFARRYSEAIDELLKTLEMDPTYYPARWWLGLVYAQTGDVTGSIRELRQALDLSDNDPGIIAALGASYAAAADTETALSVIAQLERMSVTRYVAAASIAGIHARLHQIDAALRCLEQAFRDQAVEMIYLKADPRFDELRADPGFLQLLRLVGLE
jgi:serine/threonine protein kinase/tetratricopeptide (TPR) repeat protein